MAFRTLIARVSKPIYILWVVFFILVTARFILKPVDLMLGGMCFVGMGGWALILFWIIKFCAGWRFGEDSSKINNLENNIVVRILASYGCLILPIPLFVFSMFLDHLFYNFKIIKPLLFPLEVFGATGFFQIQCIAPYSGLHLEPFNEFALVFIQWTIVVVLGYWISRKDRLAVHLSTFVFLSLGTILMVFSVFDWFGLVVPFATD